MSTKLWLIAHQIMLYHTCLKLIAVLPLFLNGCIFGHQANLARSLEPSESILCVGQPNARRVQGRNYYVIFRIQVNHSKQGQNFDSVWVEITKKNRDIPKRYPLGGKNFQKNDRIKFEGTTWEIIQFGRGSIYVNGESFCRYGFLHVKQLLP
jgi:hypothetical protein